MNELHKDGAQYSCAAWMFIPNVAASQKTVFCTTNAGGTQTVGVLIEVNGDQKPIMFVSRGVAGTALNITADNAVSVDAWHYFGWTVDENGGSASFFVVDGAPSQVSSSDTYNANYTGPSAGVAGEIPSIWARDSGVASNAPSGTRLGMMAMWQGTLITDANHDSIYNATKARFGL